MKIFRLVKIWQSTEVLDPDVEDAILEAIKAGATLNNIFDNFSGHITSMQFETEMGEELEKQQNCGYPTWHINDEDGEGIPVEGVSDATAMLYAVPYRDDQPEFGGYSDCYCLYLLQPDGLKQLADIALNENESIDDSVKSYWDDEQSDVLGYFDNYKLEIL